MVFASTGRPGRIQGLPVGAPPIDIHLDVIEMIDRESHWERSTTALERGESINRHRQRRPQAMTVGIVVSDVEPVAGALASGLWEFDHSKKTLDRLLEAQAADVELRFFNGREYLRTPAGSTVWVIDSISWSLTAGEEFSLRATLILGESPRFETQFTTAIVEPDADLVDALGSGTERGRQSTIDAQDGGTIAAGAWP